MFYTTSINLDNFFDYLYNINNYKDIFIENKFLQYNFKLKDDIYSLSFDLPGYTKDEITTSVTKKVLKITAKNEKRGESEILITIPDDASDEIKLSLENGVLTITSSVDKKNVKKVKWM